MFKLKIEMILLWIVLLFFPIMAAYWRRWIVCCLYLAGCLILLITMLRDHEGWDDLAAFATLLVIVAPIYVAASLVWTIQAYIHRRKMTD